MFIKEEFFRIYQNDFEKPQTKLNNLRSSSDWINSLIPPNPIILKIIYITGLFGYINDDQKKYAWMGISVDDFEEAKEIFISPLFLREKSPSIMLKKKSTSSIKRNSIG
ncbi:MAG: hypothetical protein JXR32_10740 [Anaerolineaceae bacterium]|nr:hypothetical protein [Anaerolineaceae bacterium]